MVSSVETAGLIVGVAFVSALGLYGFYLLYADLKWKWNHYPGMK